MRFVDSFIIVGAIVSIALAFGLWFSGIDTVESLMIGLLGLVLSVLLDILIRLQTGQWQLLDTLGLLNSLHKHPHLSVKIRIIVNCYLELIERNKGDLFCDRSHIVLENTRITMQELAQGRLCATPEEQINLDTTLMKNAKQSVWSTSYVSPEAWWKTPEGRKYWDENVSALRRGVKISRIFILPRGSSKELVDILEEQQNADVDVWVAQEKQIPPGLAEDYMIVDHKVVSTAELTREGRIRNPVFSIDPLEVEKAKRRYELLLGHSVRASELAELE